MLGLAAFADEISPDLDVQIAECQRQGITHVELRGVAGKNVLDFDKSLRADIKKKLQDNGLGVIGIEVIFQAANATPVPLPASLLLLLSGLGVLFGWQRREALPAVAA